MGKTMRKEGKQSPGGFAPFSKEIDRLGISPFDAACIRLRQDLERKRSFNSIRGIEMETPVSGSSQFSIRRKSTRLFLKSAMARLAEQESSRPKPAVDQSGTTHCDDIDVYELDILMRKERQFAANQFRLDYTYGSSTLVDGCNNNSCHTQEKKTCIWFCDNNDYTSSWWCKSSGIMWVAVHGTNSICVVTGGEKLDKTRVGGLLRCQSEMEVLRLFRETVISEIEDLANPPSGLNQLNAINQNIKKPFGVVSTIQGLTAHEGCNHEQDSSSADYDEKKAVKFLQMKMKSGSAFTYDETVQTTILAFSKLLHQNISAKAMRVCVLKEDGTWELPLCEIREQIAAIRSKKDNKRAERSKRAT